MLVGAYPFEDQEDPKNFRKTIQVNCPSSSFRIIIPYLVPYLLSNYKLLYLYSGLWPLNTRFRTMFTYLKIVGISSLAYLFHLHPGYVPYLTLGCKRGKFMLSSLFMPHFSVLVDVTISLVYIFLSCTSFLRQSVTRLSSKLFEEVYLFLKTFNF